jgi:hypothetical protein
MVQQCHPSRISQQNLELKKIAKYHKNLLLTTQTFLIQLTTIQIMINQINKI